MAADYLPEELFFSIKLDVGGGGGGGGGGGIFILKSFLLLFPEKRGISSSAYLGFVNYLLRTHKG